MVVLHIPQKISHSPFAQGQPANLPIVSPEILLVVIWALASLTNTPAYSDELNIYDVITLSSILV